MRLKHLFVESFPETLEVGTVYVSMQYANVAHLCACGCGHEVVTPIRRRDGWKLIFDGESVSLSPSIGSRNLACRSHYFITENRIVWALPLDQFVTLGTSGGEFIERDSVTVDAAPVKVERERPALSPMRRILDQLMFWRRE